MEKVKIGVIGIGSMGSSHVIQLNEGKVPNAEMTAVCDIDPARLEWAKEFNPDILRYDDYKKLIADKVVDMVIIATPHYLHPVIGIDALEAGLHVLSEKPLGVYTKQAKEFVEKAEETGNKLVVMLNCRPEPYYKKIREMVQGGELGELKRTVWIITNWYRTQNYYNSGTWRATWCGEGGGVLLNQAPHNLDLWQWICGMPVKVHSHIHYGKWHDIEVEDDVTTYVEYPNGATGVFITTTGDAHGTNRLEIQMDKAKIVSENAQITLLEYDIAESEFTKTNTVPFGSVPAHAVEVTTDGKNEQHVGVLNAWADAILRGGEMIAHGEEGINGLTLSNAMHLSSFLGKTIELPLDEDLYYEELMKRVATSRLKENVNAVVADTSNTYGGAK